MTTGSSNASRAAAGGISTYLGQERALRADRLGAGGLLLSVLAPLIGLACAGLWLESRRIQESPRGAIHGVLRA